MTLTLWRGDQRLGELFPRSTPHEPSHHRAGKPPSLSAFLIRDADAPPCEGVWQVAARVPGLSVQQYPVEADIVAQRYQRAARPQPRSGPVPLRPVSPNEAKGIPPEQQLTVHDSLGRVYLPLQIALHESRFEPEHYAGVLREAPANALVDGVVWGVLVVFASELDAPATNER
jgi:hypothetical protein